MTSSEISMSIPAESRFVALARVAAASLAAELDFTIDEIEELRVGANELVAILIETAEDQAVPNVDLRFLIGSGTIELWGSVPGADSPGTDDPLDYLTTQILDAVVDEHQVGPSSGHIIKRRASA